MAGWGPGAFLGGRGPCSARRPDGRAVAVRRAVAEPGTLDGVRFGRAGRQWREGEGRRAPPGGRWRASPPCRAPARRRARPVAGVPLNRAGKACGGTGAKAPPVAGRMAAKRCAHVWRWSRGLGRRSQPRRPAGLRGRRVAVDRWARRILPRDRTWRGARRSRPSRDMRAGGIARHRGGQARTGVDPNRSEPRRARRGAGGVDTGGGGAPTVRSPCLPRRPGERGHEDGTPSSAASGGSLRRA